MTERKESVPNKFKKKKLLNKKMQFIIKLMERSEIPNLQEIATFKNKLQGRNEFQLKNRS